MLPGDKGMTTHLLVPESISQSEQEWKSRWSSCKAQHYSSMEGERGAGAVPRHESNAP